MTVTNAWKSEFTYDGKMRRRMRKEYTWRGGVWVLTNDVRYVYDGNLVVQERDGNNIAQVSHTRGKDLSGSLEGAGGIGGLLARTDNGQLTSGSGQAHAYYHADPVGNITALINAQQVAIARYTYEPFGNTLSASGPLADANLYRFSSKEAHGNSGLRYYLYRYHDPIIQRWLNRDPLSDSANLTPPVRFGRNNVERVLGANLYWPFRNDPANSVDRDGRIIPVIICIIVAGVLSCGCSSKKPPKDQYPDCWDRLPGAGGLGLIEKERQCRLCCANAFGGPTKEGGDDDALEKCITYCVYKAAGGP